MPKVNLYVTDELRDRMKEHPDLNWSQLASEAFDRAINLERTKAMSIEQASIERLRNERASAADRREAEGVALGKQWAAGNADYETLENVAAIELSELGDDSDSALYRLAQAYLDDERPSSNECREMSEHLFGRELPSYPEVCGFVIGASEIFDQV